MDVNSIEQNINVYNSNTSISQYGESEIQASVTQVQGAEVQPPSENESEKKEYTKDDLDKALKKLNNFLKDDHTYAEYSYYKDLKTTMIKIVDEDTHEVLLEIPPKKILDMIASMCRQVGLLDKKA